MEEDKKLYPMKFCSLQDEYVWGSEEFALADLGYRDSLVREGWLAGNTVSEVMETYLDRVCGERVYDYYGRQFPVCVRVLRVRGKMPLRVHPDDEVARQRYDLLGKEKLWYVLRCGKGASVAVGFKKDSNASELLSACADGTVEGLLNIIAPYKGQCLVIPAGTPHAAFGDVDILEIGESSPLDFCLTSWGAELGEDEFDSSLETVDALDFINYSAFVSASPSGNVLVDLPQFRVEKMPLPSPVRVRCGEGDSFSLYVCVGGAAEVKVPDDDVLRKFSSGELLLVPAECDEFSIVPAESGTVVLEISVNRVEKDGYINPAVPASLER